MCLLHNAEISGLVDDIQRQDVGALSAWMECQTDGDMNGMLRLLKEEGLVNYGGSDVVSLTSKGFERLESLQSQAAQTRQAFVAMWFDPKMNEIYNKAFVKGIEEAGYKPHRADKREYNDKVDDEIIVQIRRSRFIVSDFTGHRGGVYYEAGFAKGFGLQVIFTYRKDELVKLHFDVRQYNCIDWQEDQLPEFVKRLTDRIKSVFGHGSYRL